MSEDLEVKYILKHIGANDPAAADVVRVLLDQGIISHTAARGVRMVYEYEELSKQGRKTDALYQVAARSNVTTSCVKKNLRKFRR